MARGSRTVVTEPAGGIKTEGYVKTGQTFYPGMGVIKDASVDLIGGRHTYKIYDESADGDHPTGGIFIVTEEMNALTGGAPTASYAAGTKVSLYSPRMGEELNLLIKNLSGTADDHTKGEKLILDTGTGMFIATTGSPETEMAELLESITDPVADTVAWCVWSGY